MTEPSRRAGSKWVERRTNSRGPKEDRCNWSEASGIWLIARPAPLAEQDDAMNRQAAPRMLLVMLESHDKVAAQAAVRRGAAERSSSAMSRLRESSIPAVVDPAVRRIAWR